MRLAVCVLAASASACGSDPPPEQLSVPPAPPEPAAIEVVTRVGPTRFVFRASPLANLTFQLDCLAVLTPCSVEAYRARWKPGWTADDDAAVADWKLIRTRYDARIDDGVAPREPASLPLPHHPSSLGTGIRIAGFGARDLDEYAGRVQLVLRPQDAAKLRQVVERFLPRAQRHWKADRARLEAAATEYAALVARPEIAALLAKIAAFYRADRSADQIFELMARPADHTNTYAEMLGALAVVEVMEGDPPARQLPVVLHELFHSWFASSPIDDQAELARRFVAARDPLAGPAWGLLDEVLATAFGNGLVQRALDPAELARLRAGTAGLYADPLIDAGAQALLDEVDRWLARALSIADRAVVEGYLRRIHAAFPAGMPPTAYLRPLACWSSAALASALDHLQQVSNAAHIECSSDPADASAIATHPAWGTAVLLTTAELATRREDALLDRATLAKLRAAQAPLVYTEPRSPLGTRFVLVADDDAAMQALIDAFAALPAIRPGSWRPPAPPGTNGAWRPPSSNP